RGRAFENSSVAIEVVIEDEGDLHKLRLDCPSQ
ncbi:MAG: hypothetical protein RIS49_741, partial [Actinomycetota bacterium]